MSTFQRFTDIEGGKRPASLLAQSTEFQTEVRSPRTSASAAKSETPVFPPCLISPRALREMARLNLYSFLQLQKALQLKSLRNCMSLVIKVTSRKKNLIG